MPLDNRELTAVTSELTLVETIVGPRKAGNVAVEHLFRKFLTASTNFCLEPVSINVLEKVTDLRATYGFKIPDAIHLATGIVSKCDLFVTADKAWARAGVNIVDPLDVSN